MKKLIVVFTLAAFGTTTNAVAQSERLSLYGTRTTAMSGHNTWTGPVVLTTDLKQGQNTVFVKELSGTLILAKSGDTFSNVIYKDASGKSISLTPTRGGTNGAPKPECKSKLPDACFSSADKNIGICICKSDDLSAAGHPTYKVTFNSFSITRKNQ